MGSHRTITRIVSDHLRGLFCVPTTEHSGYEPLQMQSSLEQEMPDLPLHAHGDWNIFLHTGNWPLHQPAGNYEVVSKRISARVISSQKNG
jgi:hypothetical protein